MCGPSVGAPLTKHPTVRMISLTGDVATGARILGQASDGIKRTHLELAYHVPQVVVGFLDAALGGIDINVQQRLPIGGQRDDMSDVKGWIEEGQQHMNGYTALWYARSRHNTSDYDRMRRQHEVEEQVLQQMDPANVLSRVQQIMSAGEQLVETDIPSGMLFEYKNLAVKAKSFGIKSLSITPPKYDPQYPIFKKIQADIQAAFNAEAKK